MLKVLQRNSDAQTLQLYLKREALFSNANWFCLITVIADSVRRRFTMVQHSGFSLNS